MPIELKTREFHPFTETVLHTTANALHKLADCLYQDYILLTGTSNPNLAIEVGKILGKEVWSGIRGTFKDGEVDCKIPVNVRRRKVDIIHPTGGRESANRYQTELELMIRAAQKADAAEITAIIPYLAYQRADKKDETRVPIAGQWSLEKIEAAGADRIVTVDIHNEALQSAVRHAVIDNVYTSHCTIPAMEKVLLKEGMTNVWVQSPDVGGLKRARWYRNALMADKKLHVAPEVLAADKIRIPGVNDNSHTTVQNLDYQGWHVILFDDILNTGRTLIEPARQLMEMKYPPESVSACVASAVWAGDAIENIRKSNLKYVFVTDTLPQPKEALELPQVILVPQAPLFAGVIRSIQNGDSLSDKYIKVLRPEIPAEPLYTPRSRFSLLKSFHF